MGAVRARAAEPNLLLLLALAAGGRKVMACEGRHACAARAPREHEFRVRRSSACRTAAEMQAHRADKRYRRLDLMQRRYIVCGTFLEAGKQLLGSL